MGCSLRTPGLDRIINIYYVKGNARVDNNKKNVIQKKTF